MSRRFQLHTTTGIHRKGNTSEGTAPATTLSTAKGMVGGEGVKFGGTTAKEGVWGGNGHHGMVFLWTLLTGSGLDHWTIGLLDHWSIGALEHWTIRASDLTYLLWGPL